MILAEIAVAARNGKRHNDAVPGLQPVFVADLDDFTHELMSQNVAALHAGHEAVVQMHVGTADGGERDTHDDVARINDVGIGHGFDTHIPASIPAERLHDFLLWKYF